MKGDPVGFWGKLDRGSDGRALAWHPLQDHCADVAFTFDALLRYTVLRDRFGVLAGGKALDEILIARLAVIACLHDIGKFNQGFQAKAWPDRRGDWRGHVQEALALFRSEGAATDRLLDALELEPLIHWCRASSGETLLRYLIASICHHGTPHNLQAVERPAGFVWRASDERDPVQGVAQLRAAVERWFPLAFTNGGPPLPDDPEFLHAYSGLVMLADWVGSDQRLFRYAEDLDTDRAAVAQSGSKGALEAMGFDVASARISLPTRSVQFEDVAPGFAPRPIQTTLRDLELPKPGSVVVLEAETGAGKSEAALLWFLRLFKARQVDGVYFALPTRTAATQLFDRIVDIAANAFPEKASRPTVVLAVPGYIRADHDEAMRLPGFDVLWNDDRSERFRFRTWAAEHPKRYMGGCLVVGTIDQALLGGLRVPHAHMRSTALMRHLLVVDEVHASDAYMTAILQRCLSTHVAAGGPALLMSATLGAEAAGSLLATASRPEPTPEFEDAIARPYPLVTVGEPGVAPLRIPVAPSRPSRAIDIQMDSCIAEPKRIAAMALDRARRGARALVIRNTVLGCREVQTELEQLADVCGDSALLFRCQGVVAPHHARYAPADRRLLDKAIEEAFGKKREGGGCVAIATQTVQQSLDLDADWMATDLCPMDVLLQRVGRLHRHDERERPEGFERAALRVLTPADRDLSALIDGRGRAFGGYGIGSVYEDLRVLEATWQELSARTHIRIPGDNRQLVEASTHPERLHAITRTGGEPFAQHDSHVLGITQADCMVARLNVIDRNLSFGEFGFPSRAAGEERVQTRLGELDRQFHFKKPIVGPFGEPVVEIRIPAWLARGVTEEVPELIDTRDSNLIYFRLGATHFVYDRMGLIRRGDRL